jgi:cytochrome P450
MLEDQHRRFGDVFGLSILGPRYQGDTGLGPLAQREVTVFARPEHVDEIFRQSIDVLQAGEAQRFLEWFLGAGSLMVLDGAEHRDERHLLLSLFTADRLEQYEQTLRATAARIVSRWPTDTSVDLGFLADRALETMNLELALGPREDSERLFQVSRRARVAFSAPVLFLPFLRARLGPWSPGGLLARVHDGLREILRDPQSASHPHSFLAQLRRFPGDEQRLLDRLLTLLGGMDNASAAVAWCIRHLLADREAQERAAEEARGLGSGVPGPDSWLEAVCKESLRLHPPFPVVVRRAARTTTIGGVTIPAGGFVMGAIYLMHRRAELFPDPTRFLPERFFRQVPRPGTYAPFGAGVRRCLGTALATRQMRVLLAEILRQFDLSALQPVRFDDTRRNVTVIPAERLSVRLRPAAQTRPIPGPPHSALVQTLLSFIPSLRMAEATARRAGPDGIFQARLLGPPSPPQASRLPLIGQTIVVVSEPELLKEVFAIASPPLSGGAARAWSEWFFGPDSLLVMDGADHLQERRKLLTMFTQERLAEGDLVTEAALDTLLGALPDRADLPLGPWLEDLAIWVALRLMFGAIDKESAARLHRVVRQGLTRLPWSGPMLLFPWLRNAPFGPGARAAGLLATFREILDRQVVLTREGTDSRWSWLAQLLSLEPESAEDPSTIARRVARVLTVMEGMETVGTGLRWTFLHLIRNPEVLARVQEDARAGESIYLEAACKEACRLHPPVPVFSRKVEAPVMLGPYRVEKGWHLVGAIYLTHRDPRRYPDPERFSPDRFLAEEYSPFEYLPFGGGVRRCLGHAIGIRLMTQITAAILRRFDVIPRSRPGLRAHRRAVMLVPNAPLDASLRRLREKASFPTT